MSDGAPKRLFLVGGGGGLVGASVLEAFRPDWRVWSLHRSVAPNEGPEVEWLRADVGGPIDWTAILRDVDCVVNLAWYRWAPERRFVRLRAGLLRLIESARRAEVPRFLHVSVPSAPEALESGLPYLREKRVVDAALASSGLSYRILRPTMLFGRRDRLLGVMMRLMRRYRWFPMFGEGAYHISPIAVDDLARALRLEAERTTVGTVDLGGPRRFEYRELTDRLFHHLGRRPRYVRLSRRGALQLTALMVRLGSTILYPYEVEWLMSDRLGLAPYEGLDRPLADVEPYLSAAAARLGVPTERNI